MEITVAFFVVATIVCATMAAIFAIALGAERKMTADLEARCDLQARSLMSMAKREELLRKDVARLKDKAADLRAERANLSHTIGRLTISLYDARQEIDLLRKESTTDPEAG